MTDWIEWKHGRMSGEALMPPWEHGIKDDEVIVVRFRDGRESTNKANRFSWHHAGGNDDIIAFRLRAA